MPLSSFSYHQHSSSLQSSLPSSQHPLHTSSPHSLSHPSTLTFPSLHPKPTCWPDFRVWVDKDDADRGGPNEYDVDEDKVEEVDNKKDYDVEYDHLAATASSSSAVRDGGDDADDITMVKSKSFVSTQGWDSEMIVDYRINEGEFHKISLLDCVFFIRRPPDPDSGVLSLFLHGEHASKVDETLD